MPKTSSAKKNPANPDPSRERKPDVRGTPTSRKSSAAGKPRKKPSTSKAALKSSESIAGPFKSSSASTELAPPPADPPAEGSRPLNPGPRVSIGTALCEAGFDERAVAREYVQVVQSLAQPKTTDRSGATKLLVDVLKECSRQLDSTAGHRSGEAPVVVQLVHAVARPARPAPAL